MKEFMRKYGGFVRMFLVLGLVIAVLAVVILYTAWEDGKWPVVKSFQSPNADYRVEIVDWDTAGFRDTGAGSIVYFRKNGGYGSYHYPWEDIDVQWAPDGANFFLTIETVDGEVEYRIVEQKSGENPDGVSSWHSTQMIPKYREPDLQAVLTDACGTYPGFPSGWGKVSFTFVQWQEDSETVTFAYQTNSGASGLLNYHYPSGEITELYA